MVNKISNFVLLTILFLLQSCSGGWIGNFLESSFDNNPNKKSQNDSNKELKTDKFINEMKLLNKKDEISKIKSNNESKSLNIANSNSTNNNDENIIRKQNQNFIPKSYRVFVILKKVDPSSPTENFSRVLRNGNVNFEIEKIELIPELNQNKNK